jgi:glutaredoxin-related protein
MKIIMYGTQICPNCVEAKELLKDHTDIELDYRNITETTATLKEFLSYRDHEDMFHPIKDSGRIGIPFFILEDGTKTFELSDFIEIEKTDQEQETNSCSINRRGNC